MTVSVKINYGKFSNDFYELFIVKLVTIFMINLAKLYLDVDFSDELTDNLTKLFIVNLVTI